MIDSVGLWDPDGIRMELLMAAESPELLDHMLQDTDSNYQPGICRQIYILPINQPDELDNKQNLDITTIKLTGYE